MQLFGTGVISEISTLAQDCVGSKGALPGHLDALGFSGWPKVSRSCSRSRGSIAPELRGHAGLARQRAQLGATRRLWASAGHRGQTYLEAWPRASPAGSRPKACMPRALFGVPGPQPSVVVSVKAAAVSAAEGKKPAGLDQMALCSDARGVALACKRYVMDAH